jgi:hypothetical protein
MLLLLLLAQDSAMLLQPGCPSSRLPRRCVRSPVAGVAAGSAAGAVTADWRSCLHQLAKHAAARAVICE